MIDRNVRAPRQLIYPGGPGPPAFDPSSLNLTGWWRGSYAGSPWTGEVSSGSSGARSLSEATNPPATGTALNGYVPASFDGINDILTGINASNFITAGAWTFVGLINITTLGAMPDATKCEIMADAGGFFGIGSWNSGGPKVVAYQWDGNAKNAQAAVSVGAWVLVQAKYDGVALQIRVNNGAWTTAPAGNISGTALANPLRVGRGYTAIPFAGSIMELMLTNTALSDETLASVRGYINARYGLSV